MNKFIVAVTLVVAGLASCPADAQELRYSGVAMAIAEQGNAAVIAIRDDARAAILAQQPVLPPLASVLAALRRGGATPATTIRATQ